MLPLKLRLKMLNKLAQVAGAPASPGSPASPASPAAPGSPSSPASTTDPTSTTQPAAQPPPSFNMASGPWAWMTRAYNPTTVRFLSVIFGMLNSLMHYATGGDHNLARDQNNLGSIDSSQYAPDGKNAILLAQLFYKTFVNGGTPVTPTATQINAWADSISSSQPLLNLSQLNPTGPAAQQMKLSDTFKQTILNNLAYIKQNNPIQQQQQR
jgi:hypothetical protein